MAVAGPGLMAPPPPGPGQHRFVQRHWPLDQSVQQSAHLGNRQRYQGFNPLRFSSPFYRRSISWPVAGLPPGRHEPVTPKWWHHGQKTLHWRSYAVHTPTDYSDTLEVVETLAYHTSMALTLDTSRQFRSIEELDGLVHAISLAPLSESEPDWLEWKREADLNDKRWHALIAKCIAGFANRDPITAKRWAGGCSYMVVGAEPGNVSGVAPIDNANLHAGISRFVRQTVRWSPQYIQYEGKQVLVITVEPPEYGDQIVAMLTDYQSHERNVRGCRKGDVFVRRHGRIDLAAQEDFDMLVRRFAASAEQASGINVQVLEPVTAVTAGCGPDDITTWYERQERALLEPLELGTHDGIGSTLWPSLENRSPDDYRRQVASYLDLMASLAPSITRAWALVDRAPNMQLVVINETEHNFTGVRVEVSIEGEVWAYRSAEDAQPEMPNLPRKWLSEWFSEPAIYLPNIPQLTSPDLLGPYIDNSGSARIEFHDVDLRPSEQVKLDPIYLVCDAKLAGATLKAQWTATSSSARGIARGEFPIEVSSEIVSPLIE